MKKQRTITSIMTIIFSITILLQVIVLLSIVYVGRVPEKIRQETYQSFDKNISESTKSVNDIIKTRLDFYPYITKLSFELRNHFGGNLTNVLNSSREEQLRFLEEMPVLLMNLIGVTDSKGAFIILENSNISNGSVQEKEGIYISFRQNSNDISSLYETNVFSKDLNVDLYNLSIKENSNEKFVIDTNDDNNKFYNELKDLSNTNSLYSLSPYITPRYQSYLSENVINISYPIIDLNANCVAIIGLEFTLNEFFNISNEHPDISYVLGFTDSNNFKIESVLSWGAKKDFLNNKFINVSNLPTLDKYYSLANDKDIAISVNRLNFYKDNRNPYTNENWVFLGFISVNSLVGSSNYIENVILIIITLSLVFGALMIWLTVTRVAKPIKVLSEQVRDRPTNEYFEFEKSEVEEVNNLILSFEKLAYDVLQYSNKLTNAINTFLLGIYFYQDEEKDVYCTQPFLDMCGANLKEGYIDREIFNEIYNDIISSYYYEKYEAYQLPNEHWVKLDTKVESNFTLGIVNDITDQINEVQKTEKELEIDVLTKLYNRLAFQKYSNKMIEKYHDKDIAVIMWDIDKLKYINDRYGHEVGDRYIVQFANAIRILENYEAIVARRSGDEFFAIVTAENKDIIERILEKVRSSINQCVLEISNEITEKVRASVGVAWYPENGTDIKTLLNFADKKLYQSKFEFDGLSNLINYNIETNINLFHFNKELAKIIDGDYVTFAYQPIVNAKNGEIFGYEMLMRIFSDILSNPKKLIDIARENEKLDVVEELTFKKGFESYQMNINNIKNRKIFINSISNVKLTDRAIDELLELTSNNLDMLVVELTSLLSADKSLVLEKVEKFRSLNAQIAIDNFKFEFIESVNGNIHADFIKVDISIIKNIQKSIEHQKILEDIIKYAKINNYKVIAVGINNYQELEFVINSGVDYLQGYYLGEPTVKPTDIKDEVINEIQKLQDN